MPYYKEKLKVRKNKNGSPQKYKICKFSLENQIYDYQNNIPAVSSFYFRFPQTFGIMSSTVAEILSMKPTIEAFEAEIEKIAEIFHFEGFGFFFETGGKITEVKNVIKSDAVENVTKKFLNSVFANEDATKVVIKHIDGYRATGFTFRIGRVIYASTIVIDCPDRCFRCAERMNRITPLFLAIFYHVNLAVAEDAQTLSRLKELLNASGKYSLVESRSRIPLGSAVSPSEALQFLKSIPTDRLTPQHIETGNRFLSVIGRSYEDSVYGRNVKVVMLEDQTVTKNIQDRLNDAHSDIRLASSFLGLHRLENETTVADDSLGRELGYAQSVRSLLFLVHPEDSQILSKIRTARCTFRLKCADGGVRWYSAISAESPTHSFIGYVFSIQEMMHVRSVAGGGVDGSLMNAASDIFALFSVDIQTGRVLTTVAHPTFASKTIQDIIEFVEEKYRPKVTEAFESIKTKTSQVKLLVTAKVFGKWIWYDLTIERMSREKAIILFLNTGDSRRTREELIEAKALVDLALYNSNVIQWTFEDTNYPERVFASRPMSYEPIRLNWTSLEHNVSSDHLDRIIAAFKKGLETGRPFEVEVSMFFDRPRTLLIRGQRKNNTRELFGVYFDLTELRDTELLLEQQRQQALEATNAKSKFLANMTHEIRTPLNGMFSLLELLLATPMTEELHEEIVCVHTSFLRLLELLNDTLDLAKIEQNRMYPSPIKFVPLEIIEPLILQFHSQTNPNVRLSLECTATMPLMYYGDPHFLMRVASNLISNAIKFTENGVVLITLTTDEREQLIISVKDSGIGISAEKQKEIFEQFTQLDSSITRPYGGSGVGLALVINLMKLVGGTVKVESEPGKGSNFTATFPYEAVYYPYISPSLIKRKIQILDLSKYAKDSPFASINEFYGFQRIGDESEAVDVGMVAVDKKVDEETIARIRKRFPDAIYFYFVESKDQKVPSGFQKLSWPRLPSKTREAFLAVRFARKKQNEAKTKAKIRVLVADDNPTNQLVMRKVLEKIGCEYEVASNGMEAIDLLLRTSSGEERIAPFDIVLMDQHMPEMDGPEAARQIRASPSAWNSIPIVAMTASTMKEDEDECINAGMNSFVTKPVTIAKLKRIISSFAN